MSLTSRRDVFQAIADPTRRGILGLLALHAMTPNTLADHFESSRQGRVSKHVSILTECGLVTQRQSGREIYYHLDTQKIKEVDIWLEPFRRLWESRFNQLDDLLNNIKNNEND